MALPASFAAVVFDPAAGALRDRDEALALPQGTDILVEVAAVSVNPVDLKLRQMIPATAPPKRLGFDAVGTVVAAGPQAEGLRPGDRVWYAGDAGRDGSNGAYHLVDSRLVARAPHGLGDADAAAMPLTALTGWEALFERFGYAPLSPDPQPARLLVINGAGGVGSVTLQLARLSGIDATATAGRVETQAWCREMGATDVVDHRTLGDLPDGSFDSILCAHSTDAYFAEMGRLIAPMGRIVSIVGARERHDLGPLFRKSASFGWEYMFTRSAYGVDPARQGAILARVAGLMAEGRMRSTRTLTLEGITAATLEQAHRTVDAGHQIGKLVVTR